MLQDVFVPTVISTLIIWCAVRVQVTAEWWLLTPRLPVIHNNLLEHLYAGGHLGLDLVVAQSGSAVLCNKELEAGSWNRKQTVSICLQLNESSSTAVLRARKGSQPKTANDIWYGHRVEIMLKSARNPYFRQNRPPAPGWCSSEAPLSGRRGWP